MTNIEAILVSRIAENAEALRRSFAPFGVQFAVVSDGGDALQVLPEQPVDMVFVDFADEAGATSLVQALSAANANSVILLVGMVQDEGKRALALDAGAHFVVYTPANDKQAQSIMTAANGLMKRNRRRGGRVPVQFPVSLSWKGASNVEAVALDLSEGGMDIVAAEPPPSLADVNFSFELPQCKVPIHGSGVVAWARGTGEAGIRFDEVAEECRDAVADWLQPPAAETKQIAKPTFACKLTDLSLGGCYMETESPFPLATRLDLRLKAGEHEAHAGGLVRVQHPGAGMGVEFMAETGPQREAVERFLQALMSGAGATPELTVVPRELMPREQAFASNGVGDDALLDLLRNENRMPQSEFLAKLRSQRAGEAETTESAAAHSA